MSHWASHPAALTGRRFFAATKPLALELREVIRRCDLAADGAPPLAPLVEPFLADDYELVWRSDQNLWRPRLFFFRHGRRLALEFNQSDVTVAIQSDEADEVRTRSVNYRRGVITPEPDCAPLLAEATRLHAAFRRDGLREIDRFRFVLDNGRVFDCLATCAKLALLAEEAPDFRFNALEVVTRTSLLDPRSLPMGRLFEGAAVELKAGGRPPEATAQQTPPEHVICSTLYLYGGMRSNFHKGLERLFARQREAPREPGRPFTLGISLDFEKRVWVEQVEAISRLLRLILAQYPRLELLVNGMAAPALESGRDAFADVAERERDAIAGMLAALPPGIEVRHLHGETLATKSEAFARAAFFIGPVGSASLLPLALGTPGLVYGSAAALKHVGAWQTEGREQMRVLPPQHVSIVQDAAGARSYRWAQGYQSQSYSIPPEVFLDHAAAELRRLGLLPAEADRASEA